MNVYLTAERPAEPIDWPALSSLPYSIYLLDKDNKTIKINACGAEVCGFETADSAIGRSISSVSNTQSADALLENCQQVMADKTEKIFDEHHVRHDGASLHFLSFKFPCYQQDGQLIGLLGVSLVVGQDALSTALEKLKALGLFAAKSPSSLNLHGRQLTDREHTILHKTAQGLTAKSIAQQLGISHRTVEEHLKNVRMKFNVSSKQALLQKVQAPA